MTQDPKILVIFDVDGTIADCEHRLHHIQKTDPAGKRQKRRFDLFEAEIPYDQPIMEVVNIYKRMVADPNVAVVLLTGRNEKSRDLTEKWLSDHDLDGYDGLYMKPRKQATIPDTKQKKAQYAQIVEDFGMEASMVFEDRGRVVTMWREMGVFCVDVNQKHRPNDKDSQWIDLDATWGKNQ